MAKVVKTHSAGALEAPQVVVIAGPNGAGKTTYAETLLSAMGIEQFINADRIAQGLAGLRPETVAIRAGRIMLERIDELAAAQESFGFETTLSSRSFANLLRKMAAQGYKVSIFYVMLPSPRESAWRVKNRVTLGGHSIPADVIHRRFSRSAANLFELYLPLADSWRISENRRNAVPVEIARGTKSDRLILDEEAWQKLHQISKTSSN